MKILYIIAPLATTPWINGCFIKIRQNVTSVSSGFTSLALALACFFIGINLIKIIISITSDDEKSGFSGITLHTLVRPFIFLALILGYSPIAGAFDDLVNKVSTSIASQVPHTSTVNYKDVLDQITAGEDAIMQAYLAEDEIGNINDNYGKYHKEDGTLKNNARDVLLSKIRDKKNIDSVENSINQKLRELAEKNGYKGDSGYNGYAGQYGYVGSGVTTSPLAYLNDKSLTMDEKQFKEYRELREQLKYAQDFDSNFRENWRRMHKASDQSRNWRNVGAVVVCWFFDQLYFIMECFADIYLVILSVLGPIILSFCILDMWKDSWKGFIAKYIEVSFWKVGLSIVCYCVCNVRAAAASFNVETAVSNLTDITGMMDEKTVAVWIIKAVFSFAGIITMFKIPQIIHNAMGLASSGFESSPGGPAEAGRAIGGAVKAPVEIAKLKKMR